MPALKVTAPTGHVSILMGSIHVGVAGLRQPDARVFDGMKRYVIEHVASEGPAVEAPRPAAEALARLSETGKLGRAAWATDLSDRELEGLKERLVCNGILPASTAESGVEWLLALERPITAEAIAIRRCSPRNLLSRDTILAGYVADRKIPVFGLEVNSEVESRRLAVDDRTYVHNIRIAMTDLQARAMVTATRAVDVGDYDTVLLILQRLAANEEDFAKFQRLMIDDRNEAWMPKLVQYLDEGNAFVNVGAAHIAGKKGLVSLLKARGYRVEPMQLPVSSH